MAPITENEKTETGAMRSPGRGAPCLSCLLSLGRMHLVAGALLLAGLACDGVLSGLTSSDPYRFDEDLNAALAETPTAEPNHAAPYTGPLVARSGDEVGTVLMSSCGCGFWRAYAEIGDDRHLVRLDFPSFPDSFSSFHSAEGEPLAVDGAFIEQGTVAFGELVDSDTIARFRADRLDGAPTTGCVMCHVGEDPPRPLPGTHRIVDETTDCLACHEIAGH